MRYLLIILGILYALLPYDCIPDVFPGIGWIDDLTIVGILFWFFRFYSKRAKQKKTFSYNYQEGNQYQDTDNRSPGHNENEKEDPYSILGLPKGATLEDIKRAYRELAQKYHPDRVSHLGKEFQELAEKRFKEINKAYQELTGS